MILEDILASRLQIIIPKNKENKKGATSTEYEFCFCCTNSRKNYLRGSFREEFLRPSHNVGLD